MTSKASALPPTPFDLLVRNASWLHPLTGTPGTTPEQALAAFGSQPAGMLGAREGRVVFLGPERELPPGAVGPETQCLDAAGGHLAPGLIDPHTHLVFAGDRSHEFELRCLGRSYQEIAEAGGGIQATVEATRAAPEEELVALALPRLRRLLAFGVTTAEVKSGYGLSLADELKMLRVIRHLQALQPVELHPTLLCAHAVPRELASARARYLDLCVAEIIPQAAEGGWARFCDAFIDEGALTVHEGRRVLEAGVAHGLLPRLHADQLSSQGATALAAELGATSVDHLEQVDTDGIAALAGSGTAAILIPTATLFLRQSRYAPGRALREAGVAVALATNVNPGSAMSENVSLAMGLACLQNGLSPAEAFWAFTRGAAEALRLPQHGQLVVGGPADCVVLSEPPTALPYHLGRSCVRQVVKRGRVVFSEA